MHFFIAFAVNFINDRKKGRYEVYFMVNGQRIDPAAERNCTLFAIARADLRISKVTNERMARISRGNPKPKNQSQANEDKFSFSSFFDCHDRIEGHGRGGTVQNLASAWIAGFSHSLFY